MVIARTAATVRINALVLNLLKCIYLSSDKNVLNASCFYKKIMRAPCCFMCSQ